MADKEFNWSSIAFRGIFAVLLVFSTYNPEGYSYYHWGFTNMSSDAPAKVFVGIILLIGWAIYIRATFHSLGFLGLSLAIAFFSSLVWLLVDRGWVPADSVKVLTYITLFIISAILTTGISWSFIRRKISGQYDVVESEEAESN